MTARLGKLLRLMLGSDKPGEIAAAQAAVNRALRTQGLDVHSFVEAVERNTAAQSKTERTWRDIRQWCEDRKYFLSVNEALFISDLKVWRGYPTPKQMEWLLSIEQKIRDRQAR